MKRFLLPASALVLVVTACGAGAKPAPRVTDVGAHVPTVRVIVARRERAALREARTLEHEFVPPPGARRDRAKRDHGGILHRSGRGPFWENVRALRFWRVHEPLRAVVTFLKAHDPRGFGLLDSSYGIQRPHYARYLMRTLGSPAIHVREASRYLDETIAALPGRTVIRVEARVAWIYPRSPKEKVPSATRKIVVRAPKGSRTVTNPAKVAQIVAWFDALRVSPPGAMAVCAAVGRPDITLSFRSASGAQLAHARVPAPAPGVCDPIRFRIGNRARRPLIDDASNLSMARRLERLLDLHLPRRPRLTLKG